MTVFIIEGPFDIPIQPSLKTKMIAENLSTFWDEASKIKAKSGCYILAVRAGRGMTPLYIGKTTKSFEKECFTDHKINHYNYALANYQKGSPVMFFVTYPTKKGKINATEIKKIEDFLIQVGYIVNPDIRNIQGKKQPTWVIKGVIRSGKGKPNKSEKSFRKLFGIR